MVFTRAGVQRYSPPRRVGVGYGCDAHRPEEAQPKTPSAGASAILGSKSSAPARCWSLVFLHKNYPYIRVIRRAGEIKEKKKMIFESLYDSAKAGELILCDGGYCRWHLRRDKTITIYEIIATRPGVGSEMLELLKTHGLPITAKCPSDLPANEWYSKRGFELVTTETTKSGRVLNVWRLTP